MDTRIARAVEHTLLTPETTRHDVARLCDEALRFGFGGVCVPSAHVAVAAEALAGTSLRVVTVVGFPLGCVVSKAKVAETLASVDAGAHEIDVVIHVGALREGDDATVVDDLARVVAAAARRPVKAILETGLLSDAEKIRAAELAIRAGCAFLKTSTGTPGRGGATVQDVELLVRVAAGRARIKASGGIRTRESALAMLDAGAVRLGTSSGPILVSSDSGSSGASDRY